MNSKIIFEHLRKSGKLQQIQVDALYQLLTQGAKIETIAELVGLGEVQMEKPVIQSKWALSQRSLDRLQGVNQSLVKVVKRAIEISEYDFMVIEGLRTIETQKEYVKKGVSKTMNSFHLTGHAVDLAPLENGAIDWNNKKGQFDSVAKAMKQAAKELNVNIEWGGVWDKNMLEYDDPHKEHILYVSRQKSKGKSAFVDKPHYQVQR